MGLGVYSVVLFQNALDPVQRRTNKQMYWVMLKQLVLENKVKE